MNTTIKTGLAVMLLAISCKKENNNPLQPTSVTDASSTPYLEANLTTKYSYVKIGTQRWMTANLAVSHYRNGDRIPQVTDATKWANLTTGAWCWYNNDSANNAVYGKLYNWYAVHDPRGYDPPTGWHIPSYAEWDTLIAYLGGELSAGGQLKDTGTVEAGTGLWHAPNTGATNSSGFTGLPGGVRSALGTFWDLGNDAAWWSSTEVNSEYAMYRSLYKDYQWIDGGIFNKQVGASVRCIKD